MRNILLLSLFLMSCSQEKKISKAVNTVLYNDKAFNKVGLQWAKLNPIDTTITNTIFKSDTLTLRDTIEFHHIDEVNHTDTLFKIIKKTVYVHDSVQKYVQDNRVLNAYKDTIQSYKNQLFITGVHLTESQQETSKYKWRFFGLLGIIVLILGISIYLKFRI